MSGIGLTILLSFAGGLFYHGAQAVVFTYDITNKKTFDNIERWKDKFEENIRGHGDVTRVLVGCKADRTDREVRLYFNLLWYLLLHNILNTTFSMLGIRRCR